MAKHHRLLFVAFLMVMLAATPTFASGKFFFRGGHGLHQGFQRHQPHFGKHFSFGLPQHHRFGRPFGFQRHPRFFHTPFKHHHFSPHMWRR